MRTGHNSSCGPFIILWTICIYCLIIIKTWPYYVIRTFKIFTACFTFLLLLSVIFITGVFSFQGSVRGMLYLSMYSNSILASCRCCFIRKPNGLIAFGLLSNRCWFWLVKSIYLVYLWFIYGLLWLVYHFIAYCIESLSLLISRDICPDSTYRLSTGDVRKAPRHNRNAWVWIVSSDIKSKGLAEPYTIDS